MKMKFSPVEVLLNPKTSEARVVFKHNAFDDVYIVVKYFDNIPGDNFTFKLFVGVYDKVKDRWNTKTLVPAPANSKYIKRAEATLTDLEKYIFN